MRIQVTLEEALLLFRRLGFEVREMTPQEFSQAYFTLAKRYHPDIGNQNTGELMANINVARQVIRDSYRHEAAA